jgi:hypothetical protein
MSDRNEENFAGTSWLSYRETGLAEEGVWVRVEAGGGC